MALQMPGVLPQKLLMTCNWKCLVLIPPKKRKKMQFQVNEMT